MPGTSDKQEKMYRAVTALLVVAALSFRRRRRSTRQEPAAKTPDRYPFTGDTVVAARATPCCGIAFHTPVGIVASPLRQLNYDQYRDIRSNPDAAIWRNDQVPMRVELLPAGFLFQTPVTVSLVESGYRPRRAGRRRTPFCSDPQSRKQLAGLSLPLSGFRVRTHINSRSVWDEFLVFQGASYFRAVSKDTLYGLSARGLALKTAHPTGEEFPEFTHFWIERPSANAAGIVVHALLESPSTTGAYRFAIVPGTETIMDVDADPVSARARWTASASHR